jgi:predicted amidohydrolase
MTRLIAACIQMRSGTEPAANVAAASALIRQAAGQGATFIATPEMTNLLDIRPGMARAKVRREAEDESLPALRALAAELGVTLLVGSLAIALEDDERFANRSFLIGPDGVLIARYDKITCSMWKSATARLTANPAPIVRVRRLFWQWRPSASLA